MDAAITRVASIENATREAAVFAMESAALSACACVASRNDSGECQAEAR